MEIGAGTATKIRPLLRAARSVQRYVPVDVDATTTLAAAESLIRAFPALHVHGLVGDFERHLRFVPAPIGRRLVVFFGSTLGNLEPAARGRFLASVRRLLGPPIGPPRNRLMKDASVLHADTIRRRWRHRGVQSQRLHVLIAS